MNINAWVKKIHQCALDHGWWVDKEEDRENMTPEAKLAKHMLMVTEIAEASEEVRKKTDHVYQIGIHQIEGKYIIPYGHKEFHVGSKPEGEAVELVDTVIRIMDYFGFMGWDLEEIIKLKYEYNLSREFRHGGKSI